MPYSLPPGKGSSAFAVTWLVSGVLLGVVTAGARPDGLPGLPGLFPQLFGSAGDALRQQLIEAIGPAVFALPFVWCFIAVSMWRSRSGWLVASRCIGWPLLLTAAVCGFDWWLPPDSGGSLSGPGGSIGAFAAQLLDGRFTPVGSRLVWSAVVVLGVILAADHWVMAVISGVRGIGRTAQQWAMRIRRRSRSNGTAPAIPVTVHGAAVGAGAGTGAGSLAPRTGAGPVVTVSSAATPPRGVSPTSSASPSAPASTVPSTSSVREPKGLPANSTASPSTPLSGAPATTAVPLVRVPDSRPVPAVPPRQSTAAERTISSLPSLDLLDDIRPNAVRVDEGKLQEVAALLEKTFADFGLSVKVVGINTGPVVTQYEIALETGLRVSRVLSLSDDLALNLKVPSVRIVAPIPGRNTVGIEVPNADRDVVRLKELRFAGAERIDRCKLPLLLGKDSEGRPLIYDLADMPHLLIAGRTGTGKSVCLNSIILSLLMTRTPEDCRLLMIDPKQVELAEYGRLPHLMHPVVTDTTKAEAILAWAVEKMEDRYELLRKARVRNIAGFNELDRDEMLRRIKPLDEAEAAMIPFRMPYIVIVVDEVGDLMMQMKKEVEGHIIRLAQKSRAAGIHLILTTQRPTVDVITGLIKSNLPARICFQVADRSNSRVVLDEVGAEKLLGRGDMLFLQPNTSSIVRAQGTFCSDNEILRVVGELEVENPEFDSELLNLDRKSHDGESTDGPSPAESRRRDALYEQAVEVVIREGRGSVSLLQRALGIGYGRAARLVDYMAEDGIVGTYNGAQARDVLLTLEQWQLRRNGGPTDQLDDLAVVG